MMHLDCRLMHFDLVFDDGLFFFFVGFLLFFFLLLFAFFDFDDLSEGLFLFELFEGALGGDSAFFHYYDVAGFL